MQNDPIIEELRRIREDYASQFNHDVRAMVDDLRRREREHPELVVNYPARLVAPKSSK